MNKELIANKYISGKLYNPITDEALPSQAELLYEIHQPSGSLVYGTSLNHKKYGLQILGSVLLIFFLLSLFSFQITIWIGDSSIETTSFNVIFLPMFGIIGVIIAYIFGRKTNSCIH